MIKVYLVGLPEEASEVMFDSETMYLAYVLCQDSTMWTYEEPEEPFRGTYSVG